MQEHTIVYLGDLQRIEVRPGDRFVLTLEHEVTPEILDKLKRYWTDEMGTDVKLLILCKGMKLELVSHSKTSEK